MAIDPDRRDNIVLFQGVPGPRAKRPAPSPDRASEEPLSGRALIGIGIFVVLLVISGVWLMDTLRSMSKLQDCAMQGRKNCTEIVVPLRER